MDDPRVARALAKLRGTGAPAGDDRVGRALSRLSDMQDRRPQMPRVASDASTVARQDERQSVSTLLGRSSAGVWEQPTPEPEPEAPTLLNQRPQPPDASRVTPRPTATPALPTSPTLGQVTPGRSVLEIEQERASQSPGPVAGAAERALNVASGGLARPLGGKLADTITELAGGPDAERRRAARRERETAFQEQHPTAARLGDLAGLVGGVGGEMGVARYMAKRTAAKAAPLLDELTRIDDAMANPQPRPVQRGDVADELVGGGDTSFDFGAPAPRPAPAQPVAAAPSPAPTPDLPPLDPAVAKRYKSRSTDNLLAYYDELAERQGREGFVAVHERKAWTRQTDGAGVISGSTISNVGGRATGAAQTAARVSENVEAVLRHRGVSADDLMDRFATAQSRGFQSAEKAYRPSAMSAQYGGESGRRSVSAYGGRSGALGRGAGLVDESGRVGPLYHGTPHQFDKFDISKVGTGEGNQAYGHGIYLADRKAVGEFYRAVHEPSYRNAGVRKIVQDAMDEAAQSGLSGPAARAHARESIERSAAARPAHLRQQWHDAANNLDDIADRPAGHLLTTELPDVDPEDFLDWDKPLSQQSEKVQAALSRVPDNIWDEWVNSSGLNAPIDVPEEYTGANLVRGLAKILDDPADVSGILKQAGVAGNRYLDGASRAAGSGNYNYVVFSDEGINILERGAIGQAGEGAVPLMGAMTGGIGGGATGATQGETTGERVRNAVIGAGAGALGGYLLGRGAEKIGARAPRPASRPRPIPPRAVRGGVGVIEDAPDVATAGARAASAAPDVSQHARLSKFALDPAGEARLADEIQRVVTAEGLDPKRVVSWDETRELARSMGLDAGALASSSVKRLTGPEMLAVRNLVNTNVDQMATLSSQLVDATLPEVQRRALQMEMRSLDAQNVALLSKFVKARTQQGRDLNNLKILAERIDLPDYWLTKGLDFAGPERFTEDVRSRIVALVNSGDRGELVKYMASLRQATTMEKVETFWKANLLTNPLTHVVNVTSNMTFGALEQVKNAPAAVADRLMSLATRRRTLSGPSAQAAKASLKGAVQGVREARQVMRGIPLDDALKRWDIYREVNFDNVILDTYTKTIFRSLGAGDRVFRGAAMQASFAEQARTLAAAEGLAGKALRERAAALIANPSDEMVLRALTDAEQSVFMDPTTIGKILGSFAKNVPGGAFIVPFTRTPGAIATRGLEYSPFGLVAGAGKTLNVIQKGLRGKAVPLDVQREAAKLLGRGATGTGIVTLGYKLAEAGLATGTTSRRETSQRETNQLLGRPDGAVKLGDSWYQFNRLEPVGNLMALGANLYAAVNAAGATPSEVAGRAAVSMVRGTVDQPFLTGPRQLLDAIEDPAQTKRIGQNMAAGFIPASSFLGAVARGTDPEFRQSTDVADALQARIPGLSRKLPAHVDQFGEPAKREGGLVGSMLNPVRITRDKTTDSPLLREMASIGFTMSRRRRTADRDDAAVRKLVQSEGGLLKQYLEDLVQSSSYQRADEEDKREMMSRVVGRIRTVTGRQSRLERLQEATGSTP